MLIIRLFPCVVALAILASSTGCVALNVPSQRHHDPTDDGGLLGHWKTNRSTVTVGSADHAGALDLVQEAGVPVDSNGLHLVNDQHCGDALCSVDGFAPPPPKEPEVPWPRYHPLPTRPVFGFR